MKYIKTFEGKHRVRIDGKHVIAGDASLPQNWDWEVQQKMGFDPNSLIMSPDNCYNYLMDIEDHVDPKDVIKLMEPHVKKFGEFGFDPFKNDLKA